MSKYIELVKKLKEIFQINRPELDFGIYRILNAKADEINDYLENTLKKKISDALATAGNANKEELEKQLSTAIKAAEDAGFNPEDSPKVKYLRLQIIATSQGANEHENAVFTHMLSFFSRYYDSGDFVSKRRYKGDTYAIPYAGEEVMLHWANKDQYYIKSGENFANYSFKLDDGRKVSFKLLSADTAKENRKDNDADRRFVLIESHVRTKFDEDGNEYEEEYQPVSIIKSGDTEELVIQFEYKAVKKGTKQETLVADALQALLTNEQVQNHWIDITNREPTEKNPNRTLLEKHLTTYTQRNTADYFIHKDLGGFLSNELDFYIKNEVMNLDNLQNADVFADIEKQLRMIQCLRSIASDVIKFLAQLENFQKKLWTKKKFVTKKSYFLTLDKISAEYYPEILNNAAQWSAWQRLGVEIQPQDKTVGFLEKNQSLMVDTNLYTYQWVEKVLNTIADIEDSIDTTVFNSDNFHALSFLQTSLKNKIDCIHIDPPYNTATSGFLYKNNFKHSSWLSMMESRLRIADQLLNANGDLICHIDENEYERLDLLLNNLGMEDHGTIIWDKKNPMLGRKGIATQHEYISFRGKSERIVNGQSATIQSMQNFVEKLVEENGTVNEKVRDKYKKWLSKQDGFTGGDKAYKLIDDDGKIYRLVAMGAPEKRADPKFYVPLVHPKTGLECPVPPNGWSRTPETINQLLELNQIVFGKDHTTQPQKIVYLRADAQKQITSVLNDGKSGKAYLDSLGLNFPYCHPVSMYEQLLSTKIEPSLIMDFFAGSGTNGHAVINILRNKQVRHKQLLVEMGAHCEDVLIPRLQKVIYSDDWKNGQAQSSSNGVSYIVKLIKLENYEDALNNLNIKKSQQTSDLFEMMNEDAKSDYLLNYMIETESKGSLLSTDDFKNPFGYKMKIAVDSAGASEEQSIDLVETFNYLIGLHVNSIESNLDRGYVRIEGKLPSGERALVLWRDCEKIQYDDFTKFASRFDLFAKQKTFDVIYVNGDHNLPTAFTDEGANGVESTRTLKLRQIEPEFLELMFAPDELV